MSNKGNKCQRFVISKFNLFEIDILLDIFSANFFIVKINKWLPDVYIHRAAPS